VINHEIIKIGNLTPNFSLNDHNKQLVSITEYKGKNVLLSFHPLAWTSICAQQMKSLEVNKERFDELNTIAFGLSVDSVPSKKAWVEKELHINNTRLLADFWPHGGVAKKFGIFREKDGISERANIIIDKDQKIMFLKVYEISTLPDIEEIIQVLQKQGGS